MAKSWMPLVLLSVLSAGPAEASASVGCTASDEAAAFVVESLMTRGMGDGLFQLGGTLRIHAAGVPADLKELQLDSQNLTQSWVDERETRLRIYLERASVLPHGFVDLTVVTNSGGDDVEHRDGQYEIRVFASEISEEPVLIHGKAACTVD